MVLDHVGCGPELFERLFGRLLFRNFLTPPLPTSMTLLFNFDRDFKCFLMIRACFFNHVIHRKDMNVLLTPFLQLTFIVLPEGREIILVQFFELGSPTPVA